MLGLKEKVKKENSFKISEEFIEMDENALTEVSAGSSIVRDIGNYIIGKIEKIKY